MIRVLRHREVQYFHPVLYGLLVLILLAVEFLIFTPVGWSVASPLWLGVVPVVLLIVMMLALGRMVVEVNDQQLLIQWGWLRWVKRAFPLEQLDNPRICVFRPFGLISGLISQRHGDGTICFTTQGSRGVRFSYAGRSYLVGTCNPVFLKSALVPQPELHDEQPIQRKNNVRPVKKIRRRTLARSDWGMINPREIAASSMRSWLL
ncbi:MAG: hypothetical protein HJJLKODD_01966 [Phycisphaerae bacterium]|nr:hypothetical protein [Phycisphaerae bacterium]